MIPPYLTLSHIRYVSRVKWSNPGKGVAPFLTSRCSSYWKGSLLVALDYGGHLYKHRWLLKTKFYSYILTKWFVNTFFRDTQWMLRQLHPLKDNINKVIAEISSCPQEVCSRGCWDSYIHWRIISTRWLPKFHHVHRYCVSVDVETAASAQG